MVLLCFSCSPRPFFLLSINSTQGAGTLFCPTVTIDPLSESCNSLQCDDTIFQYPTASFNGSLVLHECEYVDIQRYVRILPILTMIPQPIYITGTLSLVWPSTMFVNHAERRYLLWWITAISDLLKRNSLMKREPLFVKDPISGGFTTAEHSITHDGYWIRDAIRSHVISAQ